MPKTADPKTVSGSDPDADCARETILASPLWRAPPFDGPAVEAMADAAMAAIAAELGLADGHGWALLLADDAALRRLNLDHRGKDSPTNVLSFPAFAAADRPESGHIGDIAIAAETVLTEALDADLPPLHHLAHMIVHGVAHLAGYDHETDREAETMEAIEVRALARLDIANPYRDGRPERARER